MGGTKSYVRILSYLRKKASILTNLKNRKHRETTHTKRLGSLFFKSLGPRSYSRMISSHWWRRCVWVPIIRQLTGWSWTLSAKNWPFNQTFLSLISWMSRLQKSWTDPGHQWYGPMSYRPKKVPFGRYSKIVKTGRWTHTALVVWSRLDGFGPKTHFTMPSSHWCGCWASVAIIGQLVERPWTFLGKTSNLQLKFIICEEWC